MNEREEFEKVFSQMPYEFDLRRYSDESTKWPGGYVSYYVQCAWDAWQERAKIQSKKHSRSRIPSEVTSVVNTVTGEGISIEKEDKAE